MRKLAKLFVSLAMMGLFVGAPFSWSAAKNDWPMEAFEPDLTNLPSLQNGFKVYANYCLGCHSLQYQRYGRTADDLGIPRELALESVVFTGQKIGELITTSMDPEQAKAWFGAAPPDLTLEARLRSPEWIYNYMKSFYVDESRPLGANNGVYENVGMPNVLLHLQGVQRYDEETEQLSLEPGTGSLSAEEFDQVIYDLSNFLYYVGEPNRLERQRLGIYVLLFLVILGTFTYLLNREFWKDVH
ncbi:MAG: cytochrome c1 [Gammaproteobacteria bacterium]|jgi:cytochrome c1|nr:cytochrome c1 [Gammaproteobacteria bacterium]